MKKILVDKCTNCPFVGHAGGFGKIAYIPVCGKERGRQLPFTETSSGGRVTAHGTDEIPDWCPLENCA